jgi:hypothetical protein
MTDKPMREVPLVIRRDPGGVYSVTLAGVDLSMLLASDGLSIVMQDQEWLGHSAPVVTMTFAAGALDLDLDAPLLAYLRERDAAECTETAE